MTLAQVRQLPSAELEEWRDWLTYKAWENQSMTSRAGA